MLTELGFAEVFAAADAETAKEILDSEVSFDVVLCDHYMPNTTGLELIRDLKADPTHARLPIILMSAEHRLEHIETALDVGASEYLVKPFNTDDLRAKLDLVTTAP